MPLYMDVHNVPGATTKDVAEAHVKDLQTQDRYGVRYLRYWVDENEGKIFCLVDAPDAEAANTVHREAHGLVADEIYRVEEGF
ncbi:MAG TPA: DUF4242 domain-containing protein [Chloroflexia bacterium]|nr:DUF4242 domain-containing protein [Chloroflexia bacterium]